MSEGGPIAAIRSHIGITVADLGWTVDFLQRGLGFDMLMRGQPFDTGAPEGVTGVNGAELAELAMLQRGDLVVEVLQYLRPDSAGERRRPTDLGYFHFALEVESFDDARTRLEAFGLTPAAEPYTVRQGPNVGKRGAYFCTDQGISVELIGGAG